MTRHTAPAQLPLAEGPGFNAVLDLVGMRAVEWTDEEGEELADQDLAAYCAGRPGAEANRIAHLAEQGRAALVRCGPVEIAAAGDSCRARRRRRRSCATHVLRSLSLSRRLSA